VVQSGSYSNILTTGLAEWHREVKAIFDPGCVISLFPFLLVRMIWYLEGNGVAATGDPGAAGLG
jgi:hypothetical protein